jgi:hypothetical protein
MTDLKDDIHSARKTIRRLRDAFEQMTGTPNNTRSVRALEMSETLRAWEEEFGADSLKEWAQEHEREMIENHGADTVTE